MLEGKKYIIFDLDGTLIDSVGIWNDTDCALIRSLGGRAEDADAVGLRRDALLRDYKDSENPYEEYCAWIGRTFGSRESGKELLRRRDAIAEKKLAEDICYKPGAAECLRRLKARGLTLILATTTRRKNIDIYRTRNANIRKEAPLDDYFSGIYTREDVSAIKPDPEVHEKILKETGAKREECLIFEDSLTGILAAAAAGISAAAVYDRHSEADWKAICARADRHFKNYEEILKEIDR